MLIILQGNVNCVGIVWKCVFSVLVRDNVVCVREVGILIRGNVLCRKSVIDRWGTMLIMIL